MKRTHGGANPSIGVHNPFGMAASQMKPQANRVPAAASPTQQNGTPAYSAPPMPTTSAPPLPAQPFPGGNYGYGYQTPSVAYTMPAAQPYPSLPPQQPFPYNPNAPVSFYGPQQPPPGPSFHHLPAPPRPNPGGPPNKRIRYDQNQPPPALPPLPQSIATPAVPGPSFSNMSQSSPAAVPFNPGPPPPHLSHPPHSGKAPLPPQNQIRPNNPANRQSKKAKDNNVPPPASSNVPPLPSNPKLPPKPTTGPPTNDAPTSKETRKPSTEPPQSGSSNAPLPRRTPHEGRGQHRNRGGGAQRGQRHKGRNANGRQRFSQLQSDPYPSHDRTQQVPKEKDKLTDFRIDALHLEFDGELVWSWKAADTQVEPKAAASEPKNLKETESSTDVGQTSAAAPVDLQSNGATGQTEDEGDEQRISALLVPRPSSTQELKSDNNPPEEETLQRPTSAPETPSGDREIELQTNSKPQTTDSSVRTSSDQPQASFPVPSKHGREEEEATTEVADGSDDKALQGNRNKKMRAESPARRAPDLSLTSTAPPIGRENSRLRIYFATANSQPSSRQKSSSKTKSKSTSLKRKDPPSSAAASPARSLRQSSLDTSTNREGNGAAEEEDLDGEPVQPEAVPTADQSQGEGAHTLPTEGTEAAVALKETKQDKLGSNEEKSKADTTLSEGDSTPTAVVPDEGAPSEPQMEAPSEPAADRVSISYARNQRRLVIDADIVRDLTIKRSEGRIECTMPCEDPTSKADQEGVQQERLDHHRTYRGILLEALNPSTNDYQIIKTGNASSSSDEDKSGPADMADPLLPPLLRMRQSDKPVSTIRLIAFLDKANPLTESRWVRTGEPDAWSLQSTASKGGVPESAWAGKIHVADPDPPPSFMEIAQGWADQHPDVSARAMMRTFVDSAFSDVNNIVELMLCLIRGGDLPPSRGNPSTYRQPQVAELFARALSLGAPQPSEQSSLSLATFAMFKLALDHGVKAGLGQGELHNEVSEIVRQLPTSMLHKAMDAQYRAWMSKQVSRS